MKKFQALVLLWLFAAAGLSGQSAAITSPKANEPWPANSLRTILWGHSGQALVRLVLLAPSGAKAGIIRSKLPLANGSFLWSVGKLENGQVVVPAKGYKIQLRLEASDAVLDKSGAFEIQPPAAVFPTVTLAPVDPRPAPPVQKLFVQKVLTIHSPKGGDFWKPLSDYAIIWEAVKNQYPASTYNFDVTLASADNAAFTPLVLKKSHWAVARSTDNSNIYTFTFKFLGSLNIPSGKYKLTVQSVSSADFKAKSGVFTVQNTISDKTGFLGEDEPELVIEEVFYDSAKKSMWARIRNQGFSPYSGPLAIQYQFTVATVTYNTPLCSSGKTGGEASIPNVTLNKFQSNSYLICKWPCFDKRPADFLPITGPVKYQVTVVATGLQTVSQSGVVCKSKVPDVIVDNSFKLLGKFGPDYLWAFQKCALEPRHFNWISKDTFEAKVEVSLRNWGCQSVQCKIKLYMDGNYLNGQKEVTLGTVGLPSGKETTFISAPVKFSFPRSNVYQRMLLVAHQDESANEGYADAYKNNFILTHVF